MEKLIEILSWCIEHSSLLAKCIFWGAGVFLTLIGVFTGWGEFYVAVAPAFVTLMLAAMLLLFATGLGKWLYNLRFYYYGLHIEKMEEKRPWQYVRLKEYLQLSHSQRQEKELPKARKFCLYRYLKWYRRYLNKRREEGTLTIR